MMQGVVMQKFGVLGSPISHSLSPIIHNFLFSYLGIKARYEKILVPSSEMIEEVLDSLNGANITLPYKEKAFNLCDEVIGIAQEIGAVNTIICNGYKKIGFNTDAHGFWECIKNLEIKNALILGAGGSAKAIAIMLQAQGVDVSIYNRTLSKLEFFRSKNIKTLSSLECQDYDLVIHSTSAGLDGKSLPYGIDELSSVVLGAKYIFDVIYPSSVKIVNIDEFRNFLFNRPKTAFVGFSKKGMDGLEMLLNQALFAFEIFCDGQYCFEELKALFYNSCLK